MPSTSKKQHNFMAAVANNPAFAKKAGVPQSVGQEFTKADKGKTFKEGGRMATTKMGKPTMKPGMSTAKDGMKKPTPMANTMMGGMGGMGMMKKAVSVTAMGSAVKTAAPSRDGVAVKGKTKGKMIKMAGGGYC
jgi:hypothetical protein